MTRTIRKLTRKKKKNGKLRAFQVLSFMLKKIYILKLTGWKKIRKKKSHFDFNCHRGHGLDFHSSAALLSHECTEMLSIPFPVPSLHDFCYKKLI